MILEYLRERGLRHVDMWARHVEDSRLFRLTAKEYARRYYLPFGHYGPLGNHFTAFSIKDEVVDWLDPKPPAYRGSEAFK